MKISKKLYKDIAELGKDSDIIKRELEHIAQGTACELESWSAIAGVLALHQWQYRDEAQAANAIANTLEHTVEQLKIYNKNT